MFGSSTTPARTPALLRWRYLVLQVWLVVLGVLVWRHTVADGGDWQVIKESAELLVDGHTQRFVHGQGLVRVGGGHLGLYAHHPEIQVGPGALLLSWLLEHLSIPVRYLTAILGGALFVPTVAALERVARRRPSVDCEDVARSVLFCGLLLAYAWAQATVQWRHVDDLMVVLAAVIAVWSVQEDHVLALGAAVGLGIAQSRRRSCSSRS